MDRARRIVSLVPSLTELLAWLGAGDDLVGRTRFCVAPAGAVEHIAIVGGTKNPRLEQIIALRPDLVVANREENRREDVEALRRAGLEVLVTDPNDLEGALAVIERLGDIAGAAAKAASLVRDTRDALAGVPARGPRICVLLWKEPWMALGTGTYGHDLVRRCGAENVFADRERYPVVTFDEVAERRPDLVLLPDEPYRFGPADAGYCSPVAPARVIDGRLLWWYGPRIPAAVRALATLFQEQPNDPRR